jgi:hypothetical protein
MIDTQPFKLQFKCDEARIVEAGGMLFLLIGTKRNTAQDEGVWQNEKGEVQNWDYLSEQVIASGKDEAELKDSADEYERISKLTIEEFLMEQTR